MIETFAQPAGQTVSATDVQSAAQVPSYGGIPLYPGNPPGATNPAPGTPVGPSMPGGGNAGAKGPTGVSGSWWGERAATGVVGLLFILGGLGVLSFGNLSSAIESGAKVAAKAAA